MKMTMREATERWVSEFSRIPIGIVEKLLEANPEEVQEITPPSKYDRVDVWSGEHTGEGEIVGYDEEAALYIVAMDDGEEISVESGDFEVLRDGLLPM